MPSDNTSEKLRQWAVLHAQQRITTARMNKLRDDLMAAVIANGDRDEKGNITFALPSSVSVGDLEYQGIKREARKSVTLNEERAMNLARSKGIEDEVIVREPRIDVDALYAAWQRGKITEAELDGVFDTTTNFAFKPFHT